MQPRIGEIITVENVKYITELAVNPEPQCNQCHLRNKPCTDIDCIPFDRQDGQAVIFKEVKEMEVKIQIPDNCELIKDGNTYIVKEKKQGPPKTWEKFCERYPIQKGEAYIDSCGNIGVRNTEYERSGRASKNWCVSKKEAEAFLALMQLRQLRKAWVGDWEPSGDGYYAIVCEIKDGLKIGPYERLNKSLSFPTQLMAYDFFGCFKDLCEIAKPLL